MILVCAYVYVHALQYNLFTISNVDVTVKTEYSAITILQGDDITLSCRPSQSYIVLEWSYNGSDINNSSRYQFSPPFLNHDLTISHANDTDSGNYVCVFKLKNIQQLISLTVVPSKCDIMHVNIYVCS